MLEKEIKDIKRELDKTEIYYTGIGGILINSWFYINIDISIEMVIYVYEYIYNQTCTYLYMFIYIYKCTLTFLKNINLLEGVID